ncbi:hypothetical protein SNEBB_009560 [Seison nebaliae]|nr:hypothetical protein SNEBB_009560 [Seison nebaliae]
MKSFNYIILLCLISCALCLDESLNEHWNDFKTIFHKSYKNKIEEFNRRRIFDNNVEYIKKHNIEHDLGQHTYTLGLNEYADLSNEEFVKQMNGLNMKLKRNDGNTYMEPENVHIPDSVDWRKEGYVTPIKNQEQCGSCWAFSSTGSLEGQWFRKTKNLPSLSEQNLCDCSRNFGNQGCEGGLMDQAFSYIKSNKGIDSEASYPYLGIDDTCHFKRADVSANDTGFTDIKPSKDEDALKSAVATVGPISVAIDASHVSFQLYRGGIYHEWLCSQTALDHGVLAVGYGSEKDKDYWIVKNSWGKTWGVEGYIKMSRNRKNNCGIATAASYPDKLQTNQTNSIMVKDLWVNTCQNTGTPGPQFGLPPTLGCDNHDPTKQKLPCWSMGARQNLGEMSRGPGPKFHIGNFTNKGKNFVPAWDMGRKLPKQLKGKMPNPFTYDTERMPQKPSAPKWTMRPKYNDKSRARYPGPGQYDLNRQLNGVSYSFGLKSKNGERGRAPGPGNYNTTDLNVFKPAAANWSLHIKHKSLRPHKEPGPSDYNVLDVNRYKRQAPIYTLAARGPRCRGLLIPKADQTPSSLYNYDKLCDVDLPINDLRIDERQLCTRRADVGDAMTSSAIQRPIYEDCKKISQVIPPITTNQC